MRRRIHRITRLVAAIVLAGAASAPVAAARYDAPPVVHAPQSACEAWTRTMTTQLELYGITGAPARSYLASRADSPCHHPQLTLRSLLHAGDPA
jgi:hypothetical protein